MVCPIFIDFIDNGGFLCYAVIKITLTECVLRIEVQKFTVSGMANGVRKTIQRSGSYAELHLLGGHNVNDVMREEYLTWFNIFRNYNLI